MSRRLAFLVLFAAGSWAAPPSARALGLHPCTAAIAKAVEKYVKGKYKALAKCENARSSGKLDQSINCRPADGAVTDPKTADKLAKLAAKVEPAIAKKCMPSDFPPNVLARPLGPACDSATDAATLAACITAPVQDPDVEPINVDTLIATVYDTNAPVTDAGLRACQAAISKAVSRYLPARLKTLRKCA